MDTPTKSKEQLDPSLILPDTAPYIPRRLLALKDLVDHISEKAVLDHELRAHEKEWGAIVCKFLTEMEMQSERKAVAFNTYDQRNQPHAVTVCSPTSARRSPSNLMISNHCGPIVSQSSKPTPRPKRVGIHKKHLATVLRGWSTGASASRSTARICRRSNSQARETTAKIGSAV